MPVQRRLAVIASALLLTASVIAPMPALCSDKAAIAIEQNGTVVPAQKNLVVLHKAPFSIVSTLKGTQAVSVSASGSDELMKLAQKRRLDEPFTNEFMALTLENKNSDETLFVAKDPRESYAYYFYSNPDDHRFNELTQAGGQLTGKVTVSKLRVEDAAMPVAAFTGNDLYLVFATTSEPNRAGKSKITWSDFLHIRFEP